MGIFDQRRPPRPEEEPVRVRRPWEPPDMTVGGALATSVLLARTDEAAISLSGFTAYGNGFAFTLTIMLRVPDRRRPMRWHEIGHVEEVAEDGSLPDMFLRLAVQFADGGLATNLDGWSDEPTPPTLMGHRGGGGGDRRWDTGYWVWPLPPAGPVTFICEWPAYGIGESRGEIDGQSIRDAAGRAEEIWPD